MMSDKIEPNDENLIIMGKRLTLLRENLSKQQKNVASELYLKPQVLAYYEKGKRHPDFKTLCSMAKYYNVSIDYLLGNSDFKNLNEEIMFRNFDKLYINMDGLSSDNKTIITDVINSLDMLLEDPIKETDDIFSLYSFQFLALLFKEIYELKESKKLDTFERFREKLKDSNTNIKGILDEYMIEYFNNHREKTSKIEKTFKDFLDFYIMNKETRLDIMRGV
jgi:transcriptional regulator with XRE-family HTH domain